MQQASEDVHVRFFLAGFLIYIGLRHAALRKTAYLSGEISRR